MSLSIEQIETLRSDSQYARLYIDFDAPSVVFSAQINDTFDTTDLVRDFGFDNVSSGAYTDILPGMTALIGSAPGADDLGRVRVRKAATSSRIFNGAVSDVTFVDDAFVTVIDDCSLWRKLFAYEDGVLYADEDNAYSDQHANFSPVAMAGPHRRVWLREADLTIEFDGSASYCIGSSISSYSWAFPGAVSTSDTETATPSATYNTPGRYMVSLTVTAANGKTHTARRTLRIFDANNMPIVGKVSDMVGSFADNGFSFQVTVFDSIESVRPGALVTLMARDFYGGLETSIGLFAGAENVVIQSWIAEEGIVSNPRRGSVTFRVETANYWLARMEMQTLDLANVSAAAADWTQIQGMTMAKALHHYLFWRTTLMDIVDVHLPLSDTRVIPTLELSGQTAYQQLAELGRRGFITPLSDQYNRFFCQVDPQYLGDADRNALPVIMDISKQDRRRGINFDKHNRDECAQVFLASENASGAFYSLSPGQISGLQGDIVALDKIYASSQAQSNQLAGLHRGKLNNPYPDIPVMLAANNRTISIAPAQYVEISISAEDNPRGEAFSGRAIAREVEYFYNAHTGKMTVELRLEAESYEDLSVDGAPPPGYSEINIPLFPPMPPPPLPPPPLPPPSEELVFKLKGVYVLTTENRVLACGNVQDGPMQVWVGVNPIENVEFDAWQSQVDWLSGSLYLATADKKSYYRCPASLVYGGGLLFAQMYKWLDAEDFDVGGDSQDNEIQGLGINPATGEAIAFVGNPALNAYSSEFGVLGGSIEGLSNVGESSLIGDMVLDGNPIVTIGNGKIVVTYFVSSFMGGKIKISDDGGLTFRDPSPSAPFVDWEDQTWHVRPNPIGDLLYYGAKVGASHIGKSDDLGDGAVSMPGFKATLAYMAAIDPLGEKIISATNGKSIISLDGGATWDEEEIADTATGNKIGFAWAGYDDNENDLWLLLTESGSQTLYPGSKDTIYASVDNCQTYVEIGTGLKQALILGGAGVDAFGNPIEKPVRMWVIL